ncbi:MAG: VWA domain-containing protein [Lachnospiraceae bacterium]|nr:VWA domain-containing protein [Lachnospiraceae bacterium]
MLNTQNIILIVLAAEGLLLLILTLFGKMTRKIFLMSAFITLAACAVNIWLGRTEEKTAVEVQQKEYVYMAARLTEQEHYEQALTALEQVTDSENEEYGVVLLRALDYEMEQEYRTAIRLLKDSKEEDALALSAAAKEEKPAGEELRGSIVSATLDSLAYSKDEQEELDARMKLRYLARYMSDTEKAEAQEKNDDDYASMRTAVEDARFEDAYELAKKRAETGSIRDAYLVSEMYLQNYDRHVQDRGDAEYVLLNENFNNSLISLNREAVKLADAKKPADGSDADEETVADMEKKYSMAMADYSIASEEIDVEEAKRVLRYLDSVQPEDIENDIAAQFYRAQLLYICGDTAAAEEALDHIFRKEEIDRQQWLGNDCRMLSDACLDILAGAGRGGFDRIFSHLTAAYGQGILSRNDQNFSAFCEDYLTRLYKGLMIQKVDTSAFPEISVELSVTEGDLKLNADVLQLTDTDEEIREFDIWEEEVSRLSVCYVLDISGSMEGNYIADSKRAIRESVSGMEEGTEMGLVLFDNEAYVTCPMTMSKYSVITAVESAQAAGGTNIAAGLEAGCEQLLHVSGKKVIILLSDGYDGGSVGDELMTRLVKNDIRVYTIGLEGCDEAYLRRIAEGCSGRFIKAADSRDLGSIYEDIQGYIEKVYHLRYKVSTEKDLDRWLLVSLKDSLVRARREYDTVQEEQDWTDTDDDWKKERQSSDYFRENGGEAER